MEITTQGGDGRRATSPNEPLNRAGSTAAGGTERTLVEELKSGAERALSRLEDEARLVATRKKDTTVRALRSIAASLGESRKALTGADESFASRQLERAAGSVERLAGRIDERTLDDFAGDLERLARRRPKVVLGAALLTGFALGRFLRSSARKETQEAEGRERLQLPPTSRATAAAMGGFRS